MSVDFCYEDMRPTGTLRQIVDQARARRLKFYGAPKVNWYVPPVVVETAPEPVAPPSPVTEELPPLPVIAKRPLGFNNFSTIQQYVARHYGMTRDELLKRSQLYHFAKPRQVAVYLSRVLLPNSLPEIGMYFGGRDHSTMVNAIHRVRRRATADPVFAAELETMRTELEAVLA